ncbi:ribokinase [Vespertiliibacter pulmonis]|uniref:Ribokinase n=1 Tax=Vespertiliibacter pulmonis TaxID=1443036 RepID=A0A3N4VTW4_9PAST|nr:ribokinase [Vespertiliibacter pulmonis]QLB20768.1 ribokinase [Vespertiliibacter pulmonis]RPE83419.1 ribokinase [Vespertiliibacter pulmonis]
MKNKLCVLGSINVDHIVRVPYFPNAGETLLGYDYQRAYGGKGANQAVAAARLGANVQFIGAVGDDLIGQEMKRAFTEEGIDTSAITTLSNQNTGLAMIQVSDKGENSIVVSSGANSCVSAELIEQLKSAIEQSSILLVQLEIPQQAVEYAINFAKSVDTKVVLNPAPATKLSSSLLAQIDMITPNETETEILTGIKVYDDQTAFQAAQYFHQFGIRQVLITLGSNGVYVSDRNSNKQGEIVQGFRVKAVDTTAAGDTFNAGIVTGLLEGKTLEESIIFAHAAAALSVTRIGAQASIPTREEVDCFLAEQKN